MQSSGLVHAEGSGSIGVLQVAGSRLGPGGCLGPALAAAAARAEHAGGRTVHVPVGVLEGASGIYAATLAEGWAQRGRWGRMEEVTG